MVPNTDQEVQDRGDPREGGVVGGIGADAAWEGSVAEVVTPTRRGRTRSGSQTTPPSEQSNVSQEQEVEVVPRQVERTEPGELVLVMVEMILTVMLAGWLENDLKISNTFLDDDVDDLGSYSRKKTYS